MPRTFFQRGCAKADSSQNTKQGLLNQFFVTPINSHKTQYFFACAGHFLHPNGLHVDATPMIVTVASGAGRGANTVSTSAVAPPAATPTATGPSAASAPFATAETPAPAGTLAAAPCHAAAGSQAATGAPAATGTPTPAAPHFTVGVPAATGTPGALNCR